MQQLDIGIIMEREMEAIQKTEMPWQKRMDGMEVQEILGYYISAVLLAEFWVIVLSLVGGGTSLFDFSGQSYNCSHSGKCNWQAGNAGHEAYLYICEMHSEYQSKRYDSGCLKKGFYRNTYSGRACVVVGTGV